MVLLAWLAHLYTASGLVLAFLATRSAIEHDYRTAFFWLWLQVIVDATDGMFARAVRVSHHLPWFNGAKLDDIVDYLTYVFVPAVIVWRALLVPDAWTLPVISAMLLASGYGFNRDDAAYVLSAANFPIVAANRPDIFPAILAIYDAMDEAKRTGMSFGNSVSPSFKKCRTQ